MQLFLLTAVLPAAALAAQLLSPNPLHRLGKRQSSTCLGNEVHCGIGCIDATWTCCPDGSGGCPSTTYCELLDNGKYGCCPNGEHCVGNGGAITYVSNSISYTTYDTTVESTSFYTTDIYTTTSEAVTQSISSAVSTESTVAPTTIAPTTVAAPTSASGPPISTYTGGAAGNVLNNPNGALVAVAMGVAALL